ncbi:MAG: hypothetical protein ACPGTS_00380 [Minisyncoccia bacterium]
MNNFKRFILNKFVLTLIAIIVIGLISYGIFSFFQKRNIDNTDSNTIDVAYVDTANDRFLDTDNDGAYDWEESLWPELDPNNPDSDGDGVLDGKYIEQKKREFNASQNTDTAPKKELTETQKIGRSLYNVIAAFENQGETIDPVTEEQISKNVQEYISTIPLEERTYLKEDLVRVPNSKEASRQYKKDMTAFFEKYPLYTSEFQLIFEASKDPEKYNDDLYITVKKYEKYMAELQNISVPYAIISRHLGLLNRASQLHGIVSNLYKEETDDVVTFSALVQIENILNGLINTSQKIETYFNIVEDDSLFIQN